MPVLLPIFASDQSCCVRNRILTFHQSIRQSAFAWGRTFLLGSVSLAALALAGPAAGADGAGGRVLKGPPHSAADYDLTGVYLRLNPGFGFGQARTDGF